MRFLSFGLATLAATSYAAPTSQNVEGANAPALAARQAPPGFGGFPGQGGAPGQGQGGFPGQGQGGFPGQGQGGFPGQGQGQGQRQGQGQGGPQGQRPGGVQGQGQGLPNRRVGQGGFRGSFAFGPSFERTWINVHNYNGNINNTCYLYQTGQISQGEVIGSVRDDISATIVELGELITNLTAVAAGTLTADNLSTTELVNLLLEIIMDLDSSTNTAMNCANVGLYDLLEDLFAALLSTILQLASTTNNTSNDDLLQQILDAINALPGTITTAVGGLLGTVNTALTGLTGIVNGLVGDVGGLTTGLNGLTTDVGGLTTGLSGVTNTVNGLAGTVNGLVTTVNGIVGTLGGLGGL